MLLLELPLVLALSTLRSPVDLDPDLGRMALSEHAQPEPREKRPARIRAERAFEGIEAAFL